MDAQGHPRARFVAYGILFNVIEAIFEFPFGLRDIGLERGEFGQFRTRRK